PILSREPTLEGGGGLAMPGWTAGEHCHRLPAIRVRIDWKHGGAFLGGQDPAGLDDDHRGARDVPQGGAVIMDERQRPESHVAELERGRAEAAQPVPPEPLLDAARDVARKRRADREE